MGIELEEGGNGGTEPAPKPPTDLAYLCGKLWRETSDLRKVVNRLEETIGEAPNDATGTPGRGLCRQLAELVKAHKTTRAHVNRTGVSVAAVVAAIEVIARLMASPDHRPILPVATAAPMAITTTAPSGSSTDLRAP